MANTNKEQIENLPHRLWERRQDQEDLLRRANSAETQLTEEIEAKAKAIRARYEAQEEAIRLGNLNAFQAQEIRNLRELFKAATAHKEEYSGEAKGALARALKAEVALQESQIQLEEALSGANQAKADLDATKTGNVRLSAENIDLQVMNGELVTENNGLRAQVRSLGTRVNRLKTTEGNHLVAIGKAPFGMVLRELICELPGIGPVFKRALGNVYDRVTGTKV